MILLEKSPHAYPGNGMSSSSHQLFGLILNIRMFLIVNCGSGAGFREYIFISPYPLLSLEPPSWTATFLRPHAPGPAVFILLLKLDSHLALACRSPHRVPRPKGRSRPGLQRKIHISIKLGLGICLRVRPCELSLIITFWRV